MIRTFFPCTPQKGMWGMAKEKWVAREYSDKKRLRTTDIGNQSKRFSITNSK